MRSPTTLAWCVLVPVLLLIASPVVAASPLADAAKSQDWDTVRALTQQRVDVNAAQADGATALHWATHWDSLATVNLLLGAGATANVGNAYGVTPLALACENRSTAVVEALLQAGADAKASRVTGETVLMTAAWSGDVAIVKVLLAAGADVNTTEASEDQTALMWALSRQHADVARVLVEHDAVVTARSRRGFTPMLFAARMGDLESARMLIAAGADVNDSVPDGPSALVVATVRGHIDMALFLLEQGADPNHDGHGYAALHWAAGSWETTLTGKGGFVPPEDPEDRDYEWRALTGLRERKLELVNALLAQGANPNARLKREPERTGFSRGRLEARSVIGATPFLLAAAAGEVDVMRALLVADADPMLATSGDANGPRRPDRTPGFNLTPLMAAAGVGRVLSESAVTQETAYEAAKLALELGNDINATNDYGETALHGAAHTRNNGLVEFLVSKGANLNVQTTREINVWEPAGQTPLNYAERYLQFMGTPVQERSDTGDLLRGLAARGESPSVVFRK